MDALLLALVNNNDGDDYEKVNLKENFIALFLPRSVRQMLANSSGDCIEVQEKKRKQKQNAKLGIFTSQWCRDGKKMYIKAYVQSCCFAHLKLIPFSLPSPSTLLKLPIVTLSRAKCGYFVKRSWQWPIQGRGPGGPPSPYLKVWIRHWLCKPKLYRWYNVITSTTEFLLKKWTKKKKRTS